MNIVILTDCYYPNMSATSACINKYIQKLKYRHSIDVVCPISQIHYAPFHDSKIKLHQVSTRMWTLRMRCEENIRNGRNVWINRMIIKLFRARTLLLVPFYYPTINKWMKNAFCSTLEHIYHKKRIDVIISVVNPICSTFAAKEFKSKYPDVKLISFVTDPFTYQPSKYKYILFPHLRKKKNFRNEKAIYDIADYNLFTEELYHSAIQDFHQPLDKTYSMKYILDKIDIPNNTLKPVRTKCFLLYAGALYEHRRNPERMLSVLSQVKGIILDLYISFNNCNHIVEKYLSETVKSYSAVTKDRYNSLISNEYDILVNIGNNFSLQIPSKMLELLSTGRPIINFYQLKDVHYEMIEKYPLGINIGPNDTDAVERVSDFCQQMKGKRMAFKEVEKLFPENTLDNQLALLERLIEA